MSFFSDPPRDAAALLPATWNFDGMDVASGKAYEADETDTSICTIQDIRHGIE